MYICTSIECKASEIAFVVQPHQTSHPRFQESVVSIPLIALHSSRLLQPDHNLHDPGASASHKHARIYLAAGNTHTIIQLPRLVQSTSPPPPHRRNSLLRQISPRLLPHQFCAAVHYRRRSQALHKILLVETEQRRRERACDRQLRRERRNLAAMGRRCRQG